MSQATRVFLLYTTAIISATLLLKYFFIKTDTDIKPSNSVVQTITTEELTPEKILESVNKERAFAGVAPLKMDLRLQESSRLKCADMSDNEYYDHVNPMTGKHGYEYIQKNVSQQVYASENLNIGRFDTNDELVQSWMSSAPHKKAILDSKFNSTGISVCKTKLGTTLSVQHFAQI